MVKLYYKNKFEPVSLSDLRQLNKDEILRKVTGQDPSIIAITYCGKIVNDFNHEKITENSCLRLVPRINPPKKLSSDSEQRVSKLVTKIRNLNRTSNGLNYITISREKNIARRLLNDFPELRNDARALNFLADTSLFFTFLGYSQVKVSDEEREKWLRDHPLALNAVEKLTDFGKNDFKDFFGGLQMPNQNNQPSNSANTPGISQVDLQSALAMALGQSLPQNNQQQHQQGPSQSINNTDTTQIENEPDYSPQLEQLKEFGFEDRELCMLALQQSNGDVQLALELIVDMMQ